MNSVVGVCAASYMYLYMKILTMIMKNTPVQYEKPISRLDIFMKNAVFEITGEDIDVREITGNPNFLSCVSAKIASETGLDSCDVAQWIVRSVKEYAVENT
jgi:hypothetical protein